MFLVDNGDDLFGEFMEYDFTMGADVVKCPHCGTNVPSSLFFDNEVECLECGEKFKKRKIDLAYFTRIYHTSSHSRAASALRAFAAPFL